VKNNPKIISIHYNNDWLESFLLKKFYLLQWSGIGDNVNVGVAYKLKRMVGGPAANHVGCVDLLDTVQKRVKPKYHIFGHIHEGILISYDIMILTCYNQ
jgi:hypothetical protein